MTRNLIINGQTQATKACNVHELLVEMNLDKQAVAVELNREVIPKRLHENTPLNDGDTIELVTLVGGG